MSGTTAPSNIQCQQADSIFFGLSLLSVHIRDSRPAAVCFPRQCCSFSLVALFLCHFFFFFKISFFFCFVSLLAVSLRCQTVAAGGPSVGKGKPIVWTAKDTHVLFMLAKYQLVTHVRVCTEGGGGRKGAIGDNSFDECRKPFLTFKASRRCRGNTKQPVISSKQRSDSLSVTSHVFFSVTLRFSLSFRCSGADPRSREKQAQAGPMPAP